MWISVLVGAIHLLALGIGLGAIWMRGRSFLGDLDTAGVKRTLRADTFWGVAALLWISTGLLRAFAGLEKGTSYYVHNDAFLVKMGLLVLILALEVAPMVQLIRWRMRLGSDGTVNVARAATFGRISQLQLLLVVAMVVAAVAMSKGIGS